MVAYAYRNVRRSHPVYLQGSSTSSVRSARRFDVNSLNLILIY